MNTSQIRERVRQIENAASDFEVAHAMEDALYSDFVRHVADEGPEPLAALAREVLATQAPDFPRYTA